MPSTDVLDAQTSTEGELPPCDAAQANDRDAGNRKPVPKLESPLTRRVRRVSICPPRRFTLG